MPYKIVQTYEKGFSRLTIVPTFWEAKGILHWPPKNRRHPKLIRDDRSRPGPGWDTFRCVVKRKDLPSYEEADAELRIMEQHTDTDYQEGDDERSILGTSRTGIEEPSRNGVIDFDAIAQDLVSKYHLACDYR